MQKCSAGVKTFKKSTFQTLSTKSYHKRERMATSEVTTMSEKEKKIAKALAEAAKALPDEKKEYLLGYAEGVAAMAGRAESAADNPAS